MQTLPHRTDSVHAPQVFGLKTGGRIESILMSLPEAARWESAKSAGNNLKHAFVCVCLSNNVFDTFLFF